MKNQILLFSFSLLILLTLHCRFLDYPLIVYPNGRVEKGKLVEVDTTLKIIEFDMKRAKSYHFSEWRTSNKLSNLSHKDIESIFFNGHFHEIWLKDGSFVIGEIQSPYKMTILTGYGYKEIPKECAPFHPMAIFLKKGGLPKISILFFPANGHMIISKSANVAFMQRETANAIYDLWWYCNQGEFREDFSDYDAYEYFTQLIKHLLKNTKYDLFILGELISFNSSQKTDLIAYLKSTKVPIHDSTYYDFLMNDKCPVNLPSSFEIQLDRIYGIYFFHSKRKENLKKIIEQVLKLDGMVVAYDDNYVLLMIPYNEKTLRKLYRLLG